MNVSNETMSRPSSTADLPRRLGDLADDKATLHLQPNIVIPPFEQLSPCHSTLSDKAILHHLKRNNIVIEPFDPARLSTSSYDVTLGPHYYRESIPEPGCGLYNPYCPVQVQRVWGEALDAELHSAWARRTGQQPLANIALDDRIIWIAPGETILGHTHEYIGGVRSITTMMKARSSMGRNFIEVCKVIC